jgi:hypothetical protein
MKIEKEVKMIIEDLKKVHTTEELQRIIEEDDAFLSFGRFGVWVLANSGSPLLKDLDKEAKRIIESEWTKMLDDLKKVRTVEELQQTANNYKGFLYSGMVQRWAQANQESPLLKRFTQEQGRFFTLITGYKAIWP